MYRHEITKVKMNTLRRRFIAGDYNQHQLAKEIKVSTCTVWRYHQEFIKIKELNPEKLADMNFYLWKEKKHLPSVLYLEFVQVLPLLIAEETTSTLNAMAVWRSYRKIFTNGYTYSPFKKLFFKWIETSMERPSTAHVKQISDADQETLRGWRLSNVHRNWQITTTLRAALAGYSIKEISEKADANRDTVTEWIKIYNTVGLRGFIIEPKKQNKELVETRQKRKDDIVKIMHETPKLHGINRTSWSVVALTEVYNRLHPLGHTYEQVRLSLIQLGYRRSKSREMLTSQDPKFREKLDVIQGILQNLGPKEKFFSIDEYGPVGMRIRGGRTLQHKSEGPKAVPQHQKVKGIIICTAALELSTNQVTHFYSTHKNTFEMIKLINLLIEQYKDQERLYISWDAASWHSSKILGYYLDDLNNADYREKFHTPEIVLAPLPSCTQFLNVIESVFAGLAKAVIHNSDYCSVEECKEAVSLYFETRNKHYLDNPKHAGNKIWGKELVVPKFDETKQACKRSASRGVRDKDKLKQVDIRD